MQYLHGHARAWLAVACFGIGAISATPTAIAETASAQAQVLIVIPERSSSQASTTPARASQDAAVEPPSSTRPARPFPAGVVVTRVTRDNTDAFLYTYTDFR